MFTLKDIKGAVVEKKVTNLNQTYTRYELRGFNMWNLAVSLQSSVRLRLNREKLAEAIFNKRNEQMYGLDGLRWNIVDTEHYKSIAGTGVYEAYELADAIIANEKTLIEVES